jgi:hypothetical protein
MIRCGAYRRLGGGLLYKQSRARDPLGGAAKLHGGREASA